MGDDLASTKSGCSQVLRTLLAAVFLVIFCIVSLSCGDEPRPVRIGTEGAYPPYNFINADGEVGGFERELGDELCRRANLECTWVTNEWKSAIASLMAGDYDALITGVTITVERDRLIDFTQRYLPPSRSAYVALAGAGDDPVKGKVAAQVATIQSDYLSDFGAMLLEYASALEAIAAVLSGEADAALVDWKVASQSIAEHDGRLTLVGAEVRLGGGVGIGVRDRDGELKDKLNRAIGAMKDDGSLNALIRKWFGPDAEIF